MEALFAVRGKTYKIKQRRDAPTQIIPRHSAQAPMQVEKFGRGQPIVETEMLGKKANFAARLDVANGEK